MRKMGRGIRGILSMVLITALVLTGSLAAGGAKLALSGDQAEAETEAALEEETTRVSLALSDDAKAVLAEADHESEAGKVESEAKAEQETERRVSLALAGDGDASPEKEQNPDLPKAGEEISGFSVDQVGEIGFLDADTLYLTHKLSGARVAVLLNEDENRCFEIGYRTPSIDDSDANHVFEHAILSGSGKYDSSNLFFDLAGSTYSTYVNASTYPTMTVYPVMSLSEEQLRILADAYLSCMVDPDVLRDENIFRREAIRYQLLSPEEDITISGTVYTEDLGFMSNSDRYLFDGMLKTLYGEDNPASHMNGMLYKNFQSLTYEHVKEVYEKNYHFDNAMIVLYGKLDWRDWLEFLDEHYLSDYPAQGTDVTKVLEEPIPEGYREAVIDVPVYTGAETENQSSICYALDLQNLTEEEFYQLEYMMGMIADSRSELIKEGEKRNLPTEIVGWTDLEFAHPMACFGLFDCDEKDKDALLDAVKTGLSELAENGVDEAIYSSNMAATRLSDGLTLEDSSVGVSVASMSLLGWSSLGDPDYLEKSEKVLEDLKADTEQKALKSLCGKLLECDASCTVTVVPRPGLAEDREDATREILEEMKEAMSKEEILAMVEDTQAYEEWAEESRTASGIAISPEDLPESPDYDTFTFEDSEKDGIRVYSAPVPVEDVTCTAIYFNLKDFSSEDLYDLELFTALAGELSTRDHTRDEVLTLLTENVNGLSLSVRWDLESSRPYLMAKYYTLSENYDQSMELVLELLSETDWSNLEEVLLEFGYLLPDLSEDNNTGNRVYEAIWASASGLEPAYAYRMNRMRPEVSAYYKDLYEGLTSGEEGAAEAFFEKMEALSHKLLNRDGLQVVNAASERYLEEFSGKARGILGKLPRVEREEGDISSLIRGNLSTGILTSSDADQYGSVFVKDTEGILQGSDLVYLFAANAEYFTPFMRFRNGVYSPDVSADVTRSSFYIYTYKDPNINLTRSAVMSMPAAIREMDLTEEQLDGYILSTYADAFTPEGPFSRQMTNVFYEIAHYDTEKMGALLDGIRHAGLKDQESAFRDLAVLLSGAGYGCAGNAENIKAADADNALLFDEIIDLRQGDTGEEETEADPEMQEEFQA